MWGCVGFNARRGVQGLACLGLVCLGDACPPAFGAQTSVPSSVQAGPEERGFRRRGKSLEPPERVIPAIEDTAPPYLEPPFGPLDRSFPVRAIQIEGSVLLPEDEAKRIVSPYEGKTQTLADLRRLARELTQWLRGHEYVTSRVYIPPQDVTEGVVKLQVLEGRIGEIRIEGARYSRPEMLAGRMQTKPGELFRYAVLQEDLSRLSANPDRRVLAVLVAGKTRGTTDVVVRVDERAPWHAGYFTHNAGTKLTGQFRQGVSVGHNNLTGRDDQLVLRSELSNRSDFFGVTANYLLPLRTSWGTLGVDVSHADVELGRHFRKNHVVGRATVLQATWAKPVWRTEHWETEWVTGFGLNRVRLRELGGDVGKDDLRVLRLGPNVLEQDRMGRSIVTTEAGIGFSGFLGGSHKTDPAASRANSGGQFVSFHLAGGRLQKLRLGGLELLVRGQAQLTGDRLPPAETLRLGGEETVRGYPEGEILGDYGYSGTTELRLPVPLTGLAPTSRLTLIGFVDGGAAFIRKPVLGEASKKRLVGMGVGCRWSLNPYTSALLDLGWPVGNDSSEGNAPRLYYALNVGF